jgi:hypothetical protein
LLLAARRGGPLGAETLPLDLMRLENVRSFASAVDRKLGPAQINSLVLNAGLLFPNDDTRSADTGLVRNGNFVINFLWKPLAPALRLMLRGSNTPEAAGHALAKLALGQIRPPSGRIYAALRSGIITWPDPSELARRDDVRDALWQDSGALVGLPEG